MKAVTRIKYGSPNVLDVKSITKPIPKDDEVLIRVHATTVNRTDCAIVTGKPFIMRFFVGLSKPNQPIPGTDFAGQIEATGAKVKSFKVGDRAFGFRDEGLESQAEYLTISEKGNMTTIPSNTSFVEAVASLEGAHYAYNFMSKAKVKSGQKVLVNGTTGAVGSALLQLLKYHGTYVTAVCNTKNIALIKSLGADRVIDYTCEDFTKDHEQYDFVFDAVGKSTFSKCKPLLKKRGVYISSELGPGAQNPFLAILTHFNTGKKVKFPLPSNIMRSILFMKGLLEVGEFTPVIDRTFSLEKVTEAYEYVLTGHKTGNVILSLS